jgi:hypothetical protein
MDYFQTRIFIKLIISFLLVKQIWDPTLKQVFYVFICTLSNRAQKRIFWQNCEVSALSLSWKWVKTIDSSRYTRHALQKKKIFQHSVFIEKVEKTFFFYFIINLNTLWFSVKHNKIKIAMNLNERLSWREWCRTEKGFCSGTFTVCQKTYSLNK